ncbi:hypothetical protein [Actinoalloteichus hoggarensis]|nr:hypothetical protein [Actinoalloteichus hoggarensis]
MRARYLFVPRGSAAFSTEADGAGRHPGGAPAGRGGRRHDGVIGSAAPP